MANQSLTQQELPRQELTSLPFIEKGNFWVVKPSGGYMADCRTGHIYAVLALEHMIAEDFSSLLGWCVRDMPRGKNFTGIEVGFLYSFASAAMDCSLPPSYRLAKQEQIYRPLMRGLRENKNVCDFASLGMIFSTMLAV